MATETAITRQAPYIEALGEQYGKDLTALTAKKMPTQTYAPTVAGLDTAQEDAYKLATTQATAASPFQGIGAYQPYITQAAAYTGPTGYQPFMSPYQQDVIDKTLQQYDIQSQKGLAGIGTQAAMSGNLGGGREGVMRAEYQSQSDLNRAMLEAQMLQQGFGQAQQAAQTAYGNQMQMAGVVPGLIGQDISRLGSAGAIQQAQTQATLDATREANRMAAYDPYERLGYMGAGLGNILGGMGGQYQTTIRPDPTPLQSALGILSTGLGAYKAFQ